MYVSLFLLSATIIRPHKSTCVSLDDQGNNIVQLPPETRCCVIPVGQETTKAGAVPRAITAATQAGLSERQKVTALRVANVPFPEFDTLVESEKPPQSIPRRLQVTARTAI